jgi:hypothetical protein
MQNMYCDMANKFGYPAYEDNFGGKYNQYLKNHPEHTQQIFIDYLIQGEIITRDIVEDFIAHGLDLNALGPYPCDNNAYVCPLESLAEWRRYDEMEILMQCGADPNVGSVAMSILMGHNPCYLFEVEEAENGIKLLLKYGLRSDKEPYDKEFDKDFQNYFKSNYLINFLKHNYFRPFASDEIYESDESDESDELEKICVKRRKTEICSGFY